MIHNAVCGVYVVHYSLVYSRVLLLQLYYRGNSLMSPSL